MPKRKAKKKPSRTGRTGNKAKHSTRSKVKGRRAAGALHSVQFPNESTRYRTARNALLNAEVALRRQVESVAALRRKLPVGGMVAQNYVFAEGGADRNDVGTTRSVRLSELFQPGKDTLLIYSYMYGPDMTRPCPMCTSILDALDGTAAHLTQRVNFAVVAKSSIQRIRSFARDRGWRNLRLLSSADNSYNRDYQGENEEGGQMPAMNVFVKRDEAVNHFWNSEMMLAPADKGQNQRHVDMVWPLWNLLDLSPAGRGSDWFPKLQY